MLHFCHGVAVFGENLLGKGHALACFDTIKGEKPTRQLAVKLLLERFTRQGLFRPLRSFAG